MADRLKETFGVEYDDGRIAVAYGEAVHAARGELRPDVSEHEGVHLAQQAAYGSTEAWWEAYITSPTFRFQQELEAYRAQWKWIRANRPKPEHAMILRDLALDLSGPMYGHMVKYHAAVMAISRK